MRFVQHEPPPEVVVLSFLLRSACDVSGVASFEVLGCPPPAAVVVPYVW